MPIYEYQCKACNHCFETLVFAGDDDEPTCPKCCNAKVNRLMSAACSIGSSDNKGCSPAGASTGFS